MTLIDLPGITHISKIGDQFNIHEATVSMIRKYIQSTEMVILVVVPASDDFSNCEAIKYAREYDPEGKRTIGVVTKCDLIPENDYDIVKKIKAERLDDIKLEMGY